MKARTVVSIVLTLMLLSIMVRLAEPTPRMIMLRQQCLNLMGYNIGTPDGVLGPKTSKALDRYLTTRFGPHWETVPVKTWVDVFDRECIETYESQQRKTLPIHSR